MVTQLPPIDPLELNDILKELERRPLENNKYRPNVGVGRSQCFGIVSKRSAHPDLSRQSWHRPYLHHLLMEYAKKHVTIPFTSIQCNQNMLCEEHLDRGNTGISYIVGFGDYPEGGGLWISGYSYNIRYTPLLFDGSQMRHKTEVWRGQRYSLVFHTLLPRPSFVALTPPLSRYEAFLDTDGKWKIRDEVTDAVYWGSQGLPHALKGRIKSRQI